MSAKSYDVFSPMITSKVMLLIFSWGCSFSAFLFFMLKINYS